MADDTDHRREDLAREIKHRLEQQGVLSTWVDDVEGGDLLADVGGLSYLITVKKA